VTPEEEEQIREVVVPREPLNKEAARNEIHPTQGGDDPGSAPQSAPAQQGEQGQSNEGGGEGQP
jgi:hypothetical protein